MVFFFGGKDRYLQACRCQTLRGWKRILQRWSSRSVPKVALKSPSMRDRRGSLPLLDMSTEALILARQLHMDFQEVKSIMYLGAKSQQLGHSVWRVDRCARLKEVDRFPGSCCAALKTRVSFWLVTSLLMHFDSHQTCPM